MASQASNFQDWLNNTKRDTTQYRTLHISDFPSTGRNWAFPGHFRHFHNSIIVWKGPQNIHPPRSRLPTTPATNNLMQMSMQLRKPHSMSDNTTYMCYELNSTPPCQTCTDKAKCCSNATPFALSCGWIDDNTQRYRAPAVSLLTREWVPRGSIPCVVGYTIIDYHNDAAINILT